MIKCSQSVPARSDVFSPHACIFKLSMMIIFDAVETFPFCFYYIYTLSISQSADVLDDACVVIKYVTPATAKPCLHFRLV